MLFTAATWASAPPSISTASPCELVQQVAVMVDFVPGHELIAGEDAALEDAVPVGTGRKRQIHQGPVGRKSQHIGIDQPAAGETQAPAIHVMLDAIAGHDHVPDGVGGIEGAGHAR